MAPLVNAGQAYCAQPQCLMPTRWIRPGTPWDAAHNRATGEYYGPAHRRCNRSEGARYKQRLVRLRQLVGSKSSAPVSSWRSRAWW